MRSWASKRSAIALKASSWDTFSRVMTTEILKPVKPASARCCIGRHRGGVGALAADGVVDLGRGPVERDLHVDVVAGGEALGDLSRDAAAVGGELHADVVGGGVVDQLPEVGADGGLAPADVDVEDLHALELVDDGLALLGGQLVRVAPARAGQAVGAGQVAGVGQLPGEADRRVEPGGELVDEGSDRGEGGGHAALRRQMVWESARVDRARA